VSERASEEAREHAPLSPGPVHPKCLEDGDNEERNDTCDDRERESEREKGRE
jgi:hypothetical protein